MKYDFNNKCFFLLQNSEEGEVDRSVRFEYKQDGDLVTADYYGGTIKYGKIIAHLRGDQLHLLYQCLTTNDELKAGKAIADIYLTKDNKIRLKLQWEWLNGDKERGVSEYLEK